MAMMTNWKMVGGMAATLFVLSACATPTNNEEEVVDLQTLTTSFYDGEVLVKDLKERLDEEVGKLPEPKEGEERAAVSEDVTTLLSTYLDALNINASRYDNLLGILYNDILLLASGKETLAVDDISTLEEGAVKGFWQDIDALGLKVIHDESVSSHFVQVDYDAFEKTYGEYLNAFQKNNVALQRDIQKNNFYDLAKGVPNFENIHNRLIVLDEIQDGENSKDNFHWEGERYFYYAGLLGFNEETMLDDTGNINNDAAANMLTFIENNPDSPYVSDVTEVFAAIEESGAYGASAVSVANRLINERFADYIAFISESVDETTGIEAEAGMEAEASLEGEAAPAAAGGSTEDAQAQPEKDDEKE